MIKLFFFLLVPIKISSCKEINKDSLSDVRADIRYNDKFYTIHLNENGETYVVKGVGTNYLDSLVVQLSDTSELFIVVIAII